MFLANLDFAHKNSSNFLVSARNWEIIFSINSQRIYLALDVIQRQVSLQKCEKTPLKVAEPKITASSYLHQTTVRSLVTNYLRSCNISKVVQLSCLTNIFFWVISRIPLVPMICKIKTSTMNRIFACPSLGGSH